MGVGLLFHKRQTNERDDKMNKLKIRLDTLKDVNTLLGVTTKSKGEVILANNSGYTVSGKSYLGAVYASAEWTEVYCISEESLSEELIGMIVDDD